MSFQISTILIWPSSSEFRLREISLLPGKVNFITGRAKSGKSSLLAIIDYCLGSKDSNVPNDIARTLAWVGLVLVTGKQQILIARKLSTILRSSDECLIVGDFKKIPKTPSPNSNLEKLKAFLNEACGHQKASLGSALGTGEIGFRDYAQLCFQAQHIVANPETLFSHGGNNFKLFKLKALLPGFLDPRLKSYFLDQRLEAKWQASHRKEFLIKLCMEASKLKLLGQIAPPDDSWSLERSFRELSSASELAIQLLKQIQQSIGGWELTEHHPDDSSESGTSDNAGSLIPRVSLRWSSTLDADAGLADQTIKKFSIQRVLRLAYFAGKARQYLLDTSLDEELEKLRDESRCRHETQRAAPVNHPLIIRSLETKLSQSISFYATEMNLDARDRKANFELGTLELIFSGGSNHKSQSLAGIGGAENWLGYHLALVLTLHEFFSKADHPTIPRFLAIDQVSQVFFPDEMQWTDEARRQELSDCLERVYLTLDVACSRFQGGQIIVFDRFNTGKLDQYSNGHLVADWNQHPDGLLPAEWLS